MPTSSPLPASDMLNVIEHMIQNVEKVIHGKRNVIEHILICLLCGGHVLLEDVPGVGKTMIVRAFAQSLGCSYKRIQCTPDLLPSDVIGMSIYNPATHRFEFHAGPIFHAIVHVDELNRASSKTQAAFLEAMAEKQVTVDGTIHYLEKPFLVLATQNPHDHMGTFGLPEAQLDRFLMKIEIGYPSMDGELRILDQSKVDHPLEHLQEVVTKEQFIGLQQQVKRVHIEHQLQVMIIQLIERTRNHPMLRLGGSPRASVSLMRTAQARAFIEGRSYVIPDDIKAMASLVLPHRLLVTAEAQLNGFCEKQIVDQVLSEVEIPLERMPVEQRVAR
jgi:MoxR-like ATPase